MQTKFPQYGFVFLLALASLMGCTGDGLNPEKEAATTTTVETPLTWVKGLSTVNGAGTYGALGIASSTNSPGARYGFGLATAPDGKVWLWGGHVSGLNEMSDLWSYNTSRDEWTWVSGPNFHDGSGDFGTISVPARENIPAARIDHSFTADAAGNLWLFGGSFPGSSDELWKYDTTTGFWTWLHGQHSSTTIADYGAINVAAPTNTIGSRAFASMWADSNGDVWIFGGRGLAAGATTGLLNDVWMYDVSAAEWIWKAGNDDIDQIGVYGTISVSAPGNTPGARRDMAVWQESGGLVWMFGGQGYDSVGTAGHLNDLWRFNPSNRQWTWMAGSNLVDAATTGAISVAGGVPGARRYVANWTDSTGNLWMYGGTVAGTGESSNQLWKYDITDHQWTWMLGTSLTNQDGNYNSVGVANAGNAIGSKTRAGGFSSSTGMYVFGGQGFVPTATSGSTNDVWKINF